MSEEEPDTGGRESPAVQRQSSTDASIPLTIRDDMLYANTNVSLNALRGYLNTVGREDDAYYVEQTQGVIGGLRDDIEDSQKEDNNDS